MASTDPKTASDPSVLLQIKHFGERTKALIEWGQSHPDLARQQIASCSPATPTFEALGALMIAKGAKMIGGADWAVEHPSTLVREEAVRCGVLTVDRARALFLSDDSSRELRRLLVESDCLPADDETLKAVNKLSSEVEGNGGTLAWKFLQRCATPAFFRANALSTCPKRGSLTEATANKFASELIALIKESAQAGKAVPFVWHVGKKLSSATTAHPWLLRVARHEPQAVLEMLLVRNFASTSKAASQDSMGACSLELEP